MLLSVLKNELKAESITFVYEGQHFHPDKYGSIVPWPPGFADINHLVLATMLQIDTMRREKEQVESWTKTMDLSKNEIKPNT